MTARFKKHGNAYTQGEVRQLAARVRRELLPEAPQWPVYVSSEWSCPGGHSTIVLSHGDAYGATCCACECIWISSEVTVLQMAGAVVHEMIHSAYKVGHTDMFWIIGKRVGVLPIDDGSVDWWNKHIGATRSSLKLEMKLTQWWVKIRLDRNARIMPTMDPMERVKERINEIRAT